VNRVKANKHSNDEIIATASLSESKTLRGYMRALNMLDAARYRLTRVSLTTAYVIVALVENCDVVNELRETQI
jgi:hypothetical protein